MAASTGNSLAALLSQTHLDDHDEILKAANAQLAKSKSDVDAQHVRAVALLKLDRFDDALRQIEQGGDALKKRVPLEHAYALYKTGKLAEAEQVAADAASNNAGRGAQHVLAQATYRGENFARAADVYKELATRPQDGEGYEHYNDLRINRLAVDAQLQWQPKHGKLAEKWSSGKVGREDLEAFETAYNAACSSIACGEFGQGEMLLKRAKDLCLASEDLTEEDKKAEIMPIIIQQIYVLHKLRKFDEAAKLAEEVSSQDIPDPSTRHIAHVNGMARAAEDTNPYLSSRSMQQSANLPVSDKPFAFQSNILDHNTYVMDLSSHKHKGVASTTLHKIAADPVASTHPLTASLSVVNAAAHAKGARGRAGIKQLLPLINKRPHDIGLALTIVQIYVDEGNYGAATPLLENFLVRLENSGNSDVLPTRFAPGVVGTLAALYAHAGRRSSVRTELTKAATYWLQASKSKNSDATTPPPASLLRAAGAALLESSQPADLEQAGTIFSALLAADPADRAAAAGLVASYASTHPDRIEAAQLDALTPVARLVADVDVDALEGAGVATAAVVPQTTTAGSKRSAPKDDGGARKNKKVRKSRLPKDFDPGKKVDAERWLPMRDRSYYKPKGRKGKLRQAGLTQGGVVAEEKQQAGGAGQQQQQTGGGGGGANKKKKKGKR
ncbi:signal recognition particle protein [Diplodia corticola]|uniref:Signal recognition particle subunit SRP72 n=1 Tax=Diplodia corticola TaxID=236234 RepID=A0A1J9R406_9PEZI|nr:signal recognition particle protein [Diplodia corticola]OJD36190.1 signal recognition particle protein [Diplodia corticola]